MSKTTKSGWVCLYSCKNEFVVSKKFRFKSERIKIIEVWKRMYALQNKKYYLIIKPDE